MNAAPESLRIAFMGTPDFAVPALQSLIDHGYHIACVYSQPPRPKGRGQQVQRSPIHALADAHNIEVRTPRSFKKEPHAQADFAALDLDVAVVAAYGLILPQSVLDAPRFGCLNIHASLLPRWRGASPIQHAIWHGDEQTGITIMQMEQGLDTGPMIEKRAVAIRPQTTAQSLHDELAALGGAMIPEVLARLAAGQGLQATLQDNRDSTYAPLLRKEDGYVDWTAPAARIDCQIRALNPWPGVCAFYGDKPARLKILAAEPVPDAFTVPPGTLIDRLGHVACGDDTGLRLLKVQPENGRAMDVAAAVNGGYLTVGDVLGGAVLGAVPGKP